MAGLLVRLKLRLVGNALSRGWQPALGFLMSIVFALAVAVPTCVLLWTTAGTEMWGDLVTVVYGAAWVGWLVLPALTFTSDETLDPRRFALLPVPLRRLAGPLLAAGLVGVGPVATLVAATGAAFGGGTTSQSVVALLLALTAAVSLVVVCVVWSRALMTAASRMLASRRGRDVVTLAGGLLGVAVYAAVQLGPEIGAAGNSVDLSTPASLMQWLPGGLAGRSIAWAVAGRTATALAGLVGVAAWIAVGAAAFALALSRAEGGHGAARPTRQRRGGFYSGMFALLPRNRTTAVAVRFLRTLTRDARARTQALGQAFVVVPIAAVSVGNSGLDDPWAPALAAILAVPGGLVASNQLGIDGPALWQHEVAGEDPARDLLGRNLGIAVLIAPFVVIAAVVLAALSGGWSHVPAALLLATAVLATTLGVANIAAVMLPIALPEEPGNMFAAAGSGQGCLNGFLAMFVFFAQFLLTAPLVLTVVLPSGPAGRTIAAAVGVLYGGALLVTGTSLGAARLRGRGPELLLAVDPRRS